MTSPSLQEPCTSVNWLDLPSDVSASIIRRLSVVDILASVQYVCPRWRRICRDPSMWRSLHCQHHWNVNNLPKLYRLAVDLSSCGLTDVNLDDYFDGLLDYITDRSKHLKRISVGYWPWPSEDEFMKMADKFPFLEELDLSMFCFSSEVVATIGRLCPLLYSLKFDASDDDHAIAIAKNISGLRRLHILDNWLTNAGLIAILDGCQHLEYLNLGSCSNLKLDDDLRRRCSERIEHFYCHSPSTYELLDYDDDPQDDFNDVSDGDDFCNPYDEPSYDVDDHYYSYLSGRMG